MKFISVLAVMREKGKITAFAQHIIDTFRTLYSDKGISGRKFSREITEDNNPTRISNIENVYNNDKYSPELIIKGLNYFGKTMQEILPDDLLDDDVLIEKTRTPILTGMSINAALNSLIEEGYLDEPRLRSEITAHYNSFLSEKNHKKDSDFSAQLEDLYNEGKLLKVQNKEEKLIRFVRNADFKED